MLVAPPRRQAGRALPRRRPPQPRHDAACGLSADATPSATHHPDKPKMPPLELPNQAVTLDVAHAHGRAGDPSDAAPLLATADPKPVTTSTTTTSKSPLPRHAVTS
jgi:hypothetical protein